MSCEANFDVLVGPTHNYGGLALGNLASQANRGAVSNPQAAARQGLAKMRTLMSLGFVQGVLPPQERPDISALRRLGFSGSEPQVLAKAYAQAPQLLLACSSSSSMWAANACTVSPSADTADGRVHFTAANLSSSFHRSLEAPFTSQILRSVFSSEAHFAHHAPLPDHPYFADEGAANHSRFCRDYAQAGVELFVYGRSAAASGSSRYPARQSLEASQAIARLHGLADEALVFAQQNPEVIDQGVFHNDVIALANGELLLYHQQAFTDTQALLRELQGKLERVGASLYAIEVPQHEIGLQEAISSYLFNSQLLRRVDGSQLILVPQECQANERVWSYLQQLCAEHPVISQVHVVDLQQSMRNGGGPACLRLRVVLTQEQLAAVNSSCILDAKLNARLEAWIDRHYRDRLTEHDLADRQLLMEGREALDELTQILNLGSIYRFQRV